MSYFGNSRKERGIGWNSRKERGIVKFSGAFGVFEMNRKAEGTAVSNILKLFLGLFVLFIVFLILGGAGLPGKIGLIVPGFNTSVSEYEEPEIFRYDIVKNEVEYFDGSKGIGGKEWIVNRDKRVNAEVLRKNFAEDYYYNHELREIPFGVKDGESNTFIDADRTGESVNIRNVIVRNFHDELDENYFGGRLETQYGSVGFSGDVRQLLKEKAIVSGSLERQERVGTNVSYVPKSFLLTFNGDIYLTLKSMFDFRSFSKLKNKEGSDREVIKRVVEWRDSVLDKPMKIEYEVRDGSVRDGWKRASGEFRAEKKGNYLVIDLKERENVLE